MLIALVRGLRLPIGIKVIGLLTTESVTLAVRVCQAGRNLVVLLTPCIILLLASCRELLGLDKLTGVLEELLCVVLILGAGVVGLGVQVGQSHGCEGLASLLLVERVVVVTEFGRLCLQLWRATLRDLNLLLLLVLLLRQS